MIKLNAQLKQNHIDHGVMGSCSSCPWALAIEEALANNPGGSHTVFINHHTMRILSNNRLVLSAATPPSVSTSIRLFDKGYPIEPMTAEITFSDWDKDEGI